MRATATIKRFLAFLEAGRERRKRFLLIFLFLPIILLLPLIFLPAFFTIIYSATDIFSHSSCLFI